MNFKILFFLPIFLLLIGCSTSQDTLPLPKHYQEKNISPSQKQQINYYQANNTFHNSSKTKKVKNIIDLKGDGYIKGIVKTIHYDRVKKRWIYTIQGTDTTNGKLSFAKAYSLKQSAKENDLVYAIIKHGYITSIYIYQTSKSYTLTKKRKLANKQKRTKKYTIKTPKTKHRKQLLPPPKTQTIIF